MGEGEQDGKDGSVGSVRYTRGSRVRRGSDCHGLGARGATSVVLTRWREYQLSGMHTMKQHVLVQSFDAMLYQQYVYTTAETYTLEM